MSGPVISEQLESELAELQRESCRRLWVVLVLSPTLEIAEALLRGESVPVDRLDPVWVERLRKRPK